MYISKKELLKFFRFYIMISFRNENSIKIHSTFSKSPINNDEKTDYFYQATVELTGGKFNITFGSLSNWYRGANN
ncbi:hypothetical protein QFZ77_004678 [Paenibacillus sp. V4I3]|nr:hypothetical protein [Paenibacillus sp. V4I3]